MRNRRCLGYLLLALLGQALAAPANVQPANAAERLRVLIETDAGGDPDDEQSLVRFLLYANEWDVEGIICTLARARDKENLNPERTGLGIVRRQLKAYGGCYPNLVKHDRRFPTLDYLWQRTVAGYGGDAGVKLILTVAGAADPRPIWVCNWGTGHDADESSFKVALDRVLKERGQAGYAQFKERFRLSSADKFGDHTYRDPPWRIWVDTFRPELDGRRWYHRFSALTAEAGGFDLKRNVLTGHGPLGALYPANTGLPQKEGDTMTFLYLVPTGMNDPMQPTWGSWAGRYGLKQKDALRPHFWANQKDRWDGTAHRDNTLKRWAVHLQNDFRARLNWCVAPVKRVNHAPVPLCQGDGSGKILFAEAPVNKPFPLTAAGTTDPDGDSLSYRWYVYPEAGSYSGKAHIGDSMSALATLEIPADADGRTIHVILEVTDHGEPALTRYRRLVVTGRKAMAKDEDRGKKPTESQQQYRALLQEYNKAFQEYTKAFDEAKTPQDRQKVVEEKYPVPDKIALQVLELVEKHPKEPFAEDALIWILTNEPHLRRFRPWFEHKDRYEQIWIMTRGGRQFGVQSKEERHIRDRATDMLLRDHVVSVKLGPVVEILGSSQDKNGAALLRAILDRNPSKEVKAEAAVAVARRLQARLAVVKQIKDNQQFAKSIEQINGKDYTLELQKADPIKLEAEAERFYAELTEKYLPHMKPAAIAILCQQLFYTSDSEMLLRTLYTKDKRDEVRGVACLVLGQVLMRNADGVAGKDAAAAGAMRTEGEKLLEEAAGKYANVKTPFDGTVGRKARSELCDLHHLSVGKRAPEVEGVDQDGKHFKLSDYEGKVVLLDFWSEF